MMQLGSSGIIFLKSPPSASQIKSVELRLTDLNGYAKFTIARE